ncbi:MAG: glycogen synthase GlgA [Pseudomonadota bacterium]
MLIAASEMQPLAKTGGLGDVIAALAVALMRDGLDVGVVMPGYESALGLAAAKEKAVPLPPIFGHAVKLIGARAPKTDVPVYLLDCPALFRRPGGPYGDAAGADWPDNGLRFGVFAGAIAELAAMNARALPRIDVIHAHDWHTGLLAASLAMAGKPSPPCVFTVHNMAYQGLFPAERLVGLGLPAKLMGPDGIEFWGNLSFLKAGLRFASKVTTVSPTYAREILTPEQGMGLDGVLRARAEPVIGILNGIDMTAWNPAADPHIAAPYDAGRLEARAVNKAALQQAFDLAAAPKAPLIAMLGRLVAQKGVDIFLAALPQILAHGAQAVILGTGDKALEEAVRAAARQAAGRVGCRIAYDEAAAHRLMAGADMLVMPSRFEPCGLTQRYAQRYGVLPVVRRTGGLADTVTDARLSDGNGFTFAEATAPALTGALERALGVFADSASWRALQRRAMAIDASWNNAAKAYARLYAKALQS